MPGLLRKLVIFAAVDGLILQSHGNGGRFGGNNEPQALRIDYKTNKISPLSASASDTAGRNEAGLDVYGLVGKQPIELFGCVQYCPIPATTFGDGAECNLLRDA